MGCIARLGCLAVLVIAGRGLEAQGGTGTLQGVVRSVTGAVEAYKNFDKRAEGWIKVMVEPQAPPAVAA